MSDFYPSASVISVRWQMRIMLILSGMLNILCDGVVHIGLHK